MHIILVDLHILNTYALTDKEKITLFTVSKHPTIRGMLCVYEQTGPIRVQ